MKKRMLVSIVIIIIVMILRSESTSLVLKSGVYENSPKIYTDDQGQINGFWSVLTNHLAKQEGWRIKWVHGSWNECLELLEKNEIDILIDVAYSPERARKFSFNEEVVLLSWSVLYIRKGEEFDTILDLEGKKVGALRSSYNLEGPGNYKEMVDKFQIDCQIIEKEDYLSIFESLDKGEIFAGITNKDFGNIHEENYGVKRTSLIFQPAHIKYAFPKDSELSSKIIPVLDQHLMELKRDRQSIYYQSIDEYLGGVKKVAIFPFWLKAVLLAVILFALIFFVFFWIMKYQVRQKTKELKLNIGKLKGAQDELQLMVRRWETTFNSIEDTIMLINTEHEIQEINKAGCRLAGKSKEELIGKKCYQIFHGEQKVPDFCPCLHSLSSGEMQTAEIEENGRNYQATAWAIKDNTGKITGFSHAIFDITARKRSEQKLEEYKNSLENLVQERTKELEKANQQLQSANEKLSEASRMKSQFLANMSHELRSPLNSIIGFTGIMLQGLSGRLNDEQQRQLGMVYESSKHLLGLINDILDLSKIEAGKTSITKSEMNVKELIELVSKMVSPLIAEKHLDYFVELAEDIPETIYSDSGRIKQVLVNLLSNSIKFTEKGIIKLSCKFNSEKKYLLFSVEDTVSA